MSTPVYHLSVFLMLQRVGTYAPILSPIFSIKSAPKTNNYRKIYDLNSPSSEHQIFNSRSSANILYYFTKHPYILFHLIITEPFEVNKVISSHLFDKCGKVHRSPTKDIFGYPIQHSSHYKMLPL